MLSVGITLDSTAIASRNAAASVNDTDEKYTTGRAAGMVRSDSRRLASDSAITTPDTNNGEAVPTSHDTLMPP